LEGGTIHAFFHNRNTLLIYLSQINVPPKTLSIISQTPGFLVPKDVPEVANLFSNASLISVLQTSPRIAWHSQNLSVPIIASREARVLLRDDSFSDADCYNLESEMEQKMSETQHARTLGAAKIFGMPKKPPTTNESTMSATSLSQSTRAPPLAAQVAQNHAAPFPSKYAIDMISALEKMRQGLAKVTVKKEIVTKTLQLFQECFPQSQYVRSTYYHAQKIYRDALDMEEETGLIETFIALGRRPEGTWRKFRDAVESEFLNSFF
jgi:hypothetical protein